MALLGLARRAGGVVFGVEQAARAIRAGRGRLLLTAGDASPVQLRKVTGPAERQGVPCRTVADRDRLGRAVGGPPLSAVLVTREGFARQLSRRLPVSGEDGEASD